MIKVRVATESVELGSATEGSNLGQLLRGLRVGQENGHDNTAESLNAGTDYTAEDRLVATLYHSVGHHCRVP